MKKTNNSFNALPVFLAFLCMGFGDLAGPLVSLVKDSFNLNNFQAFLTTFSGFIMFGLLSIPMGVLQDRKGKKLIMNMGLIIAFIGLIIPIVNGMYGPGIDMTGAGENSFFILLLSILILGAGATTLQVVGNPIMRDVSAEGKYSSNLSLAQSVKAVGSSLGFLLPPIVTAVSDLDWPLLFPVYSVLILINLILFNSARIEEKNEDRKEPATFASCFSLLGNPYVLMMVLAIFLYVGAEVTMSSGVPLLMKENFGISEFGLWVSWALFFLPILAGRFVGGLILRIFSPKKFFITTVFISIIGLILMFLGIEVLTFIGIILIGLGFANIFPLVFSITIDKMPERANELSGLMVTAIVGGAFIPPLMGVVSDMSGSLLMGFTVPLVCLGYIMITSFAVAKK